MLNSVQTTVQAPQLLTVQKGANQAKNPPVVENDKSLAAAAKGDEVKLSQNQAKNPAKTVELAEEKDKTSYWGAAAIGIGVGLGVGLVVGGILGGRAGVEAGVKAGKEVGLGGMIAGSFVGGAFGAIGGAVKGAGIGMVGGGVTGTAIAYIKNKD